MHPFSPAARVGDDLIRQMNAPIVTDLDTRRDYDFPGMSVMTVNCGIGAGNSLLMLLSHQTLRGAKRLSNPSFPFVAAWIASRSLSSGAHSRDPLARNDGGKNPVA
jgi:hypothetical protein